MREPGLVELVCAQPDVASSVLYWLCVRTHHQGSRSRSVTRVSVGASARAVCALLSTCTALARGWDDAHVLAELLSGRRRPADYNAGELRGTELFLRLLDLIDAAHGPRVPQDFGTVAEAVRHAARRIRGYRHAQPNGRELLTVQLAAGTHLLDAPVALPDNVRVMGRCPPGAAVVHVVGCVGFTSAGIGAQLVNLTIRSTSGTSPSSSDNSIPVDPDARPGHAVWIRGGDLLVKDCVISCAIGNAVVIGARGAPFRGQGSTQALCEAHGRLPRLVDCRIEAPIVSQPAEVGGYEGVAAGVCVEVMAAEIIDCSFYGNFNQIELGYSKPGTLIHGCRLEGAQENGVYSYDEAQARIICSTIRGGRECVRCCEGSRLVVEECSLDGSSTACISAQGQGSVIELRDSNMKAAGASIEYTDGARVFLNGVLLAPANRATLTLSCSANDNIETETHEASVNQSGTELLASSSTVNGRRSASDVGVVDSATIVAADPPRRSSDPVITMEDTDKKCDDHAAMGGFCLRWWKSLCALFVAIWKFASRWRWERTANVTRVVRPASRFIGGELATRHILTGGLTSLLRRVGFRRVYRISRGDSVVMVLFGGALVTVARRLGYQPRRSAIVRWWRRAMLHRRLQQRGLSN
eukprot:COSAG02_NODE_483_length_21396_cov_20.544801_2_plen_640_part_00